MMRRPLFRRLYETAAFVALLNMVALAVVTGYALTSGTVTGDKFQRVLALLRGAETMPEPVGETPDAAVTAAAAPEQATKPDQPPLPADLEIMRHEAERIQEELRQRLALNNSILLKVTAEREALKKEQEEAAERLALANKRRRKEEQVAATGTSKQIEIYEELAPKVAAQHLLNIQDPDDAARILLSMDPRKSRKIIEAAKRGEQIQQMTTILQRMREVEPARTTEMSAIGS